MYNSPFVFESPDKGFTIYARISGSTKRIKIDKSNPSDMLNIEKYVEWTKILEASETNPTIKIALEKLKTVYYLNKDHDSKT